jgi:hypothetical protein
MSHNKMPQTQKALVFQGGFEIIFTQRNDIKYTFFLTSGTI